MTPAVMFQGTGSNVGKSTIVAGLARLLARRGLRVAPFKPQNMSNNAAVTADGGEIGRAQALQARAAGRPPSVHMNPVLLKPESETGSQVILQGRRIGTMRAREFGSRKQELLPKVLESYALVAADADIVLVEGAGSPAEINLRGGDIANMGFAEAANLPVVLVGDIDRGGVIASLVGTRAVLPRADRDRIEGFIVNRFRGDPSLFDEGERAIVAATGWAALGVVPWFADAGKLPAEDILDLARHERRAGGGVVIAVPRLPRIANFDDLDPLAQEEGVELVLVAPGDAIPVADLVLLPGSKSTIADLAFLRRQGWDIDILAHRRRGGRVVGLCGGYQMLGRSIADPEGMEGPPGAVEGLRLLAVDTVLTPDKAVRPFAGHDASGHAVEGYEIHLGRSEGPDRQRPWLLGPEGGEGASSADGRVRGSYVHGLFAGDDFRHAYLAECGAPNSAFGYEVAIDAALDALADHLATHLDIDAIMRIAARGL
ncbi:cobyric acid synthase [Kaistia geumhonensis]|uniref:Cobyric acid synthase n=1 Tax=Kaistia geumhonensis TaxID=410839 RepID=A0ABU0M1D7_9HYPH|nr:cobyric acid synthase [Kaistia geumhonensis]MCX5480106.1 cobyric acid synthase [Kaistia geumhonensis]MDQ0514665.1 adenosylcobyric acid synthase [Kaistia geumhonensis]